jgi:hypothetical protein
MGYIHRFCTTCNEKFHYIDILIFPKQSHLQKYDIRLVNWNYCNIFQKNIFWEQASDNSFHLLQINVKVI